MDRSIKIILSLIGVVAFQNAFQIFKLMNCSIEVELIFNLILCLIFLFLFGKEKVVVNNKKKYVLDSNIILDGRIFKLFENKMFDGTIIILNCVFNELQNLSESNDILKKNRSRGSFQRINKLKEDGKLDIKIDDNRNSSFTPIPTDQQIIEYCKNNKDVYLITDDNSLHEACLAKNIKSISFKKDIIDILKINVNINDIILVDLVKKGKEIGQAIGYTNTNLMVVVNNGEKYLGKRIKVEVINVVETASGDLVFANICNNKNGTGEEI